MCQDVQRTIVLIRSQSQIEAYGEVIRHANRTWVKAYGFGMRNASGKKPESRWNGNRKHVERYPEAGESNSGQIERISTERKSKQMTRSMEYSEKSDC